MTGRAMPNQLRALQILRAIAATSVIYYHVGCIPRFGKFGVDVFFVISGFVMSLIIANGESTARFVINRIARIVPLYWILTTAVLGLAWCYPALLDSTTANFVNYLKSLFFIPYYKENGFLQPLLSMGWSLNYEMFFYAGIWLAIVNFRKQFVFLTCLLLIACYVLLGHLMPNRVMNSFFGDYMVFEFMAGMVLYRLYCRNFLASFPAAFFGVLALVAYCFMAFLEPQLPDLGLGIFGPPAITLVYAIVRLESSIDTLPRWLIDRLVEMGDASYATYLSHYYIVAGFRRILYDRFDLINPYTPFGVLVIVAASLVVGHFLYLYLDKPTSRWTRKRLTQIYFSRYGASASSCRD